MKCIWPQCKFKAIFLKIMRSHELIHSEEKKFEFNFKNCNKLFRRKQSFKLQELCHLDEKHFKCDWNQCDKKFKQKNELGRHLNVVHLKLKKFK